MKVDAKTFEEYFALAGEREPTLRAVDKLIKQAAPNLKPVLYQNMGGGAALGYGMIPYQSKSMKTPSEWPLIGLANQKHYMAIYVCAVIDGTYVAEKNADRLGKVNVGKSCIRFKRLEDLNQDVIKEIISDVAKRYDEGEKLFGI